MASTKQHPIELPQVIVWLLRLAADPVIAASMRYDAVSFAGWYAVMASALEWPQAVLDIQKTQREKKLTLDRMMKLLGQVNYAFAGRTTADHARRVLEGYAVHDWVQTNYSTFTALAAKARDQFQDLDKFRQNLTPFQSRLKELGDALQLSALERDVLAFAFLNTASFELQGIFEQLASDRWAADHVWTAMFNTTNADLGKAMQAKSVLRVSGLLRTTGRKTELASVSQFWVDLLAGATTLADAILEPVPAAAGSGIPARLGAEDTQLAGNILRNANEPGVNLLLYGASSLEKRQLVRELAKAAGRKAWRVRKFEDAWRTDLPALALVAFNLLRDQPEPPVLVIDRPAEVLQTAPSEFIRSLFGIEMSNDSIPDFDELLLATSPVPGLWMAGDIASLPDEAVSRFVFQAPLKKADKAQRMASVLERLQGFKLSKKAVDEILKIEGVSTAQLEAAMKAARLSGAATKKERDQAVVQAVKRSQRALSRDVKAKAKESVTQYSLKYLNTAGRFGPERILEALRLNPQGSIVLYGPPGTGKTQFVEYLAKELGRPLVAKRASELFSKWLGESEKNISKAFEDAASEDAILLLDEGDSFLRDRANAQASWEVSQVNELLQAMERFDGIVVVCTNLFSGLDAAALRRFTFKVEFRELTVDQRWDMFVNEAGLKGQLSSIPRATRDDWLERLCFMQRLTAGDFATVKRQCTVLRTQLTPEEWLEQLKIECDVKSQAGGSKQLA